MKTNKHLDVILENKVVGTLEETKGHLVAFEYSPTWFNDSYSISPFSLPLRSGVFVPRKYETFEGLFGVFADSLPDGWGRLLVDRVLRENHINPNTISSLTRLSLIGENGMGGLEYRPKEKLPIIAKDLSLDDLAGECKKILTTDKSEQLDELYLLCGSSGGAYDIEGEEWLVKFPSSMDNKDIGVQEYEYSLCAKNVVSLWQKQNSSLLKLQQDILLRKDLIEKTSKNCTWCQQVDF